LSIMADFKASRASLFKDRSAATDRTSVSI
jgi:hypothetical protein